jgi:hypothetical protein
MTRLRMMQLGALLVLLVGARSPFVPTAHADGCGDGVCSYPSETATSCPQDCPPSCGDGICDQTEDGGTCPADCGTCGDARCDRAHGEDEQSCPQDCLVCDGSCSDWYTCYSCFGDGFDCDANNCVPNNQCGDWGDHCQSDGDCCFGGVCRGSICLPEQ